MKTKVTKVILGTLHKASKEEIIKLAKTQRQIVKKIITNLPEGAISYSSK